MEQEQDVERPEMIEEKHKDILRVENLSRTYAMPDGRLRVLQDIHLQVQHGESYPVRARGPAFRSPRLS